MYLEKQRELNSKQKENDHHINGNSSSRGYSSDHRSNHAEEERVQNTTL